MPRTHQFVMEWASVKPRGLWNSLSFSCHSQPCFKTHCQERTCRSHHYSCRPPFNQNGKIILHGPFGTYFCHLETHNAGRTQFSNFHLTSWTMLLYWQPGIFPCNWRPWSLGSQDFVKHLKEEISHILCWSHIALTAPTSIFSLTPWCSLMGLVTPTIPTTLCNFLPGTERGSERAEVESDVQAQSHH